MFRLSFSLLFSAILLICLGCEVEPSSTSPSKDQSRLDEAQTTPSTDSYAKGLLLSMVATKRNQQGQLVTLPARLGILIRERGIWWYEMIEDPDSNVFHKAMVYTPPDGVPGILTAGGTRAILKLWRQGCAPQVIWEADFGGKFSRMRDLEVADLYGDGQACMVVATHDQGVVAVVRPQADAVYTVEELDRQPNTIVHEVEIGDLDGDGHLEVYATPSRPNKVDGTPQPGQVVRYVPALGEGRAVVADLGERHAKEILVDDIDGDGRDELYVVVEALAGGQVEIRRYDAGTDPGAGQPIATLPDTMCRFLTAGDLEGDGQKEMVAAAMRAGVWLLRPPAGTSGTWSVECIDPASRGFEHAALLTDLNGDGRDELYVANDRAAEVNQYLWRDRQISKTTIHNHGTDFRGFTWNLMEVPVELLP